MTIALVSTYKPAAYGNAGLFRILKPGLLASALLHISMVSALVLLTQTPSRVAGAPTVTVSLIDSIEASAKKIPTRQRPDQQMEVTPLPVTRTEPINEKTDKEDSQDSVASLAANRQGKPTDMEPLREAQFSADYLHNPKPHYPALSRRLGEQGVVLLHVQVSAEGLPLEVIVKESSGFARLDQAAASVVKNWQFVPAKRGSFTLVSWVDVPLQFSLEK